MTFPVKLSGWGTAGTTADRNLYQAKLLLRLLGPMEEAGTRVYADLPALPTRSALVLCCARYPSPAQRIHLDTFLAAASVADAVRALQPLHVALAPELDDLDWMGWRAVLARRAL